MCCVIFKCSSRWDKVKNARDRKKGAIDMYSLIAYLMDTHKFIPQNKGLNI